MRRIRPQAATERRAKLGAGLVLSGNVDLGLAMVCVAADALVVGLLPDATAPRAILGVVALLVVPGYVAGVALFPVRGEFSGTARVALSVALSLAIVALLGLALNFLPPGLQVFPLLTAVALVCTATSVVALIRRRLVVASRRASTLSPPRSAASLSLIPGTMSLMVLAAGVAIAGLGAEQLQQPGRFTVFYLLDDTQATARPPTTAPSNMPFRFVVGVENHEGRPARYLLTASVGDQSLMETSVPTVLSGRTWRGQIELRVPSKGRLDFELRLAGTTLPYRRLSLPIEGGGPGGAHRFPDAGRPARKLR